jgi:hypothetical protein
MTNDEILNRLRRLRDEFLHIHQTGNDALRQGDRAAFMRAIERECQLVDEQAKLVKEFERVTS